METKIQFSNENVHTIDLKAVLKRSDLINFIKQAIIYDHHYYQFSFSINKIDQNLTIRADLNQPKAYQDGQELILWLEKCYEQIRLQIDQLIDPDDQDNSDRKTTGGVNEYIDQLFDRNFIFKFETQVIDATQALEKKLRILENENKQLKQQLHPHNLDLDQDQITNEWGIKMPPQQSEVDLLVLKFRNLIHQICNEHRIKLDQANLQFNNLNQKLKVLQKQKIKTHQKGMHL